MKTAMTRLFALLLCVLMLCASLALVSCDLPLLKNEVAKTDKAETEVVPAETETEVLTVTFHLTVTFADGSKKELDVTTDKDTVGDALLADGTIAGDTTEYGLYVKTVLGVTADWNVDQTYWGLYVDGEYSMVGISSVKAADGLRVELRQEKGM